MPSIFEIKKTIGGLKRLQEILTVFFEEGYGYWIERLKLKYLVPLNSRVNRFLRRERLVTETKLRDPAVSLRVAFERLGPSFVKLGQILSLRPDVIPEHYCKELEKLQNQAPSFAYREVEKIIRDEFKKPVGEFFKSFEEKPFAAASLAQVHKAVLKSGEVVAVKIQRPGIRQTIENDIHILLFLAHLFEKHIPESVNYQPVKLVKEFATWTMRELNFTVEATNADHLRVILKGYPNVKIPAIHWDYTSSKVLTMEFIDGFKVDDLKTLKRHNIDPQELASVGLDVFFKQFFIDGFFQADPHPGNFFALPGNVLCLTDFGMVGYLTSGMRSELVSIFMAMMDRNAEGVLKHLAHLAEIDEDSELELFQNAVFDTLSRLFYGLTKKESAAAVFYRVINVGAKYRVIFPANLIYFGKGLITIEAMGLKLWPEFDFDEALRPFMGRVAVNQLSPQGFYSELRSDIFDFTRFIKELPSHTQDLMNKLEKGDIGIRINLKEFMDIKAQFDRQNDIRVLTTVTVAVALAAAVILRLEKPLALFGISAGYLGLIISLFLVVWIIMKVREK